MLIFKIDETNADDVGVLVSSGVGGIEIMEEQYGAMLSKGYKRISPFTIPAMIEKYGCWKYSYILRCKRA